MRRLVAVTALLLVVLTGVARVWAFDPFDSQTWPWQLDPHNWSLLDPNAVARAFNPHNWPFSLIPVPEVATDPVSGTTAGLLPVLLFTDQNKQINNIIAPDINYNTIVGPGGTFRYLGYPSEDEQYYAIAGAQQTIARQVEIAYARGINRKSDWSYEFHFLFDRNPTERFFGIGNTASFNNQTNYTLEQLYAEALVGYNFTRNAQLALDLQPRRVRISQGAFTSVPFIGQTFPKVAGVNGGTDFHNRLLFTYDTRNAVDIPTSGGLITAFAGLTDRALLSSVSYTEFGFEARRYYQINNRLVIAGHIYGRLVPAGNETPFWSMSWLGGDGPGEESLLNIPLSTEATWRGYGAGRFIDNNILAANLEFRARVYEMDIFSTHGIAEIAPFVDLGRVFHEVDSDPLSSMHPAGGLGFRGIALPYVVGYVDLGYGPQGAEVFSGINYPF